MIWPHGKKAKRNTATIARTKICELQNAEKLFLLHFTQCYVKLHSGSSLRCTFLSATSSDTSFCKVELVDGICRKDNFLPADVSGYTAVVQILAGLGTVIAAVFSLASLP